MDHEISGLAAADAATAAIAQNAKIVFFMAGDYSTSEKAGPVPDGPASSLRRHLLKL